MNKVFLPFRIIVLSLVHMCSGMACEVDISDYVGYKIIYSGTVTGFIDDDGREQDSFEGCEYGRVLIVDYSNQVICQEYGYSYAYHPNITVLDSGYDRKACINDNMYDVE